MKKYLILLAIVLGLNTSLYSQKPVPVTPISPFPAFQFGEELNYILHYGIIKGGEASIVLSKDTFKGREVFHATAKAKTTGLANSLFKVLDIYQSYFDINSNLPVKAVRDIREGNYKYYDEVLFNHKENTVNSSKSGVHKVPPFIHDMVSAFFYIRRIDFSNFKGGEVVSVNTFFGDELFPFYVIFKGRETINVGSGKYKCLKFVPIVEPGRIFKENDDMTFWFSDDDNKIPVRIKFDMIVGSFKCDLTSAKNLKYNLLSKVSN